MLVLGHRSYRLFVLVALLTMLLGCKSNNNQLLVDKLDLVAPKPMSLFNINSKEADAVTLRSGKINLVSGDKTANTQIYSEPAQYIYSQNTTPAKFGEGRGELPNIQFNFVVHSNTNADKAKAKIVPLKRHLILTEHPTWDYFVGVGDIVKQGNSHLVSMPLALVEKNQNCVHNGALLIELDDNNRAGQFYYQVSSETCAYYKADMWGTGEAKLASISIATPEQKLAFFESKPLDNLSEIAPEIELSKLQLQHLISEQDMSALGVIHQGVHYAQECNTRAGFYPFCSQLVLPSYSMAKSIFAGLVAMHLQKKYGDVFEQPLNKWIKQCDSKSNRTNWQGVTFAHLLNMTTGNYSSKVHGVDEGAAHTANFFSVATHEQKLAYACNQFTRKKQPGQEFVYHTSDTYLLGTALQAYWQAKKGNQVDVFNDILVNDIFKQANLSQVSSKSRRTQDKKPNHSQATAYSYCPQT